MADITSERIFHVIFNDTPAAHAVIRGSSTYVSIIGNVMFYTVGSGTLVLAEVYGLPKEEGSCKGRIFGFHIHGGAQCTGTPEKPFMNAGAHYDTHNCPHPEHQGDMPPLFGNSGFAFTTFYTNRFKVSDIIGKTLIIHEHPDDFTTQPSGNSGAMIACGEIRMFQLFG